MYHAQRIVATTYTLEAMLLIYVENVTQVYAWDYISGNSRQVLVYSFNWTLPWNIEIL